MENQIKSLKVNEVTLSNEPTLKTGNKKFDKWFSNKGGMVKGSSILLSGVSGSGKTTLCFNLMNWMPNSIISLYEREVASQSVCEQTSNIKPKHENAYIADKKTHPHFNDYVKELSILKPEVIILDSIQAIAMDDFSDMSEDDALNHISKVLREFAEENNSVVIIISHNTKGGDFKGTNCLKQMVDAHMIMDYNKKGNFRTITFSKNRKGAIDTMFYTFEESGIEFFTTEEWDARADDRNFKEKFLQFVNNYVASSNKKNDICINLINDYNKGIKSISKIENDSEVCEKLLNLMLSLSDKYEG